MEKIEGCDCVCVEDCDCLGVWVRATYASRVGDTDGDREGGFVEYLKPFIDPFSPLRRAKIQLYG